MTGTNRVVWSEGLYLRTQHFQQQDRHVEALMRAALQAAPWQPHGFTRLELDRAALDAGQIAIRSARGLFPDGTPFSIPETAAPPPPVSDSGGGVRRGASGAAGGTVWRGHDGPRPCRAVRYALPGRDRRGARHGAERCGTGGGRDRPAEPALPWPERGDCGVRDASRCACRRACGPTVRWPFRMATCHPR